MACNSYYSLRTTAHLLALAERLLDRIEAGKQIISGSGGGKSATYHIDSLRDIQEQLDAVVCELRCRHADGDADVPDVYANFEPAVTEQCADFSC